MMNVSIASGQSTPLASPRESDQKVHCTGKAFWCCFNPMANRRQAALEAKVKDLNSKLEEAMRSQTVLSDQLLDAMTKHNALEQTMTKVQAENDDLRAAGFSLRKTAVWKVKNFSTALPAASALLSSSVIVAPARAERDSASAA
jgi:hypothetical protein